jgi:hypothetical protein
MSNARRTWVAASAAMLAAGCSAIIGSGGYYEVSSQDAAPQGAAEAGAATSPDACVAGTDRGSLESACTTSTCVPFTLAVAACDGGLCPLPAPVTTTPDTDASSPTMDGSSLATADAGPDSAATPPDSGTISCSQVAADPAPSCT